MKQSSFILAFALAAALPSAARAEPVSVSLQSSSGGFADGESAIATNAFSINLGTLFMPAAGTSATYFIDGLRAASDYAVSFNLTGVSGWSAFRAEILDPVDGDDALDPANQPSYVSDGFSTSNNLDGFSFAQDSGLERSATFNGGGSAMVIADENTHRGDLLSFTGLGTGTAAVTFGLRDRLGDRGFLLRLSNVEANMAPVPEPTSMFLIGTGLAGLAAGRRRLSARG